MFGWFKKEKKASKEIKEIKYDFNQQEAKELLAEIKLRFGLDYSKQEFITMNKIESFAKIHQCYDFATLQQKLQSDDALYEELINLLTVNETYFFRELQQIEFLSELMKKEKLNSILSAPCASGEEVYTILIHLDQIGVKLSKIIGIDINTQALQKARDGVYTKRSISKIPQHLLFKYFFQDTNNYEVISSLKSQAKFVYKNIFDDLSDLGKFDVVFSRNMLIYFNVEDKQRAIEQFSKLLAVGGYLFLGHADIVTVPQGFQKVHRTLQIYKKV